MDKELIRRNFSRCAPHYDRYATIQKKLSVELLSRFPRNGAADILELGCGTGIFTALLREEFPQAGIKAIDVSEQMIKQAGEKLKGKGIQFITADARTIDFSEQFDLIGANASFQWFDKLETVILRYKSMLRRKGIVLFSVFGPGTFRELNQSLAQFLGRDKRINSAVFLDKKELRVILKRTFGRFELQEKFYQERHNSLREMLCKIKYTGTRGAGIEQKKIWTARAIGELEKVYKKEFGSIVATYQVFYCRGEK